MAAETLAETTDAAGHVALRHPFRSVLRHQTTTVTGVVSDGFTVSLPEYSA